MAEYNSNDLGKHVERLKAKPKSQLTKAEIDLIASYERNAAANKKFIEYNRLSQKSKRTPEEQAIVDAYKKAEKAKQEAARKAFFTKEQARKQKVAEAREISRQERVGDSKLSGATTGPDGKRTNGATSNAKASLKSNNFTKDVNLGNSMPPTPPKPPGSNNIRRLTINPSGSNGANNIRPVTRSKPKPKPTAPAAKAVAKGGLRQAASRLLGPALNIGLGVLDYKELRGQGKTRPQAAKGAAAGAAGGAGGYAAGAKAGAMLGKNFGPLGAGIGGLAGGLVGGNYGFQGGQAALNGVERLGTGLGNQLGRALKPVGRGLDDLLPGINSKDEANRKGKPAPTTNKPAATKAGNPATDGRYIPGSQQVAIKPAPAKPTAAPRAAAAPRATTRASAPAAPQRAAVEQRLDQYLPPQTVSRGSLRYEAPAAPQPPSDAGMKNQDKNFKGSYGNTDDLKRMRAASLSRQQGRSNLTSEDLKPKDAPPPPKVEAPKKENRKRLSARGREEMLEENLRRALLRSR